MYSWRGMDELNMWTEMSVGTSSSQSGAVDHSNDYVNGVYTRNGSKSDK